MDADAGRGGGDFRDRGDRPDRGDRERVDRGPRNTGQVPESGNLEGTETPGGFDSGFDGERVGELRCG